MAKQHLPNPDILEAELNSEAFVSGLERALAHTEQTKRETRFRIGCFHSTRLFHPQYPYSIEIGYEDHVKTGESLSNAKKAFTDQTGLPFAIIDNMSDEKVRALSGTEYKRIANLVQEWLASHPEYMHTLRYPTTDDSAKKHATDPSITRHIHYLPVGYVDFHTHPPNRAYTPSDGDLLNLAKRRHSVSLESEINPVGVIAASYADKANTRQVGVCIYQEHGPALLTPSDEEAAARRSQRIATFAPHGGLGRVLTALGLSNAEIQKMKESASARYNFAFGAFVDGRITLDKGYDWSVFYT